MDKRCVVVLTTIPGSDDGRDLASALVSERLAACVSLLPEMDSAYRWKDSIARERERQVIIKTTADRVPALEARLRELHSYDVPEFLVLTVASGSDAYLDWIITSVHG